MTSSKPAKRKQEESGSYSLLPWSTELILCTSLIEEAELRSKRLCRSPCGKPCALLTGQCQPRPSVNQGKEVEQRRLTICRQCKNVRAASILVL